MLYCNYKSKAQSGKVGSEDFTAMTKTEKVGYLFNSGREILSRKSSGFIISLYLLEDFFVEIWYTSPNKMIENIEVTTNEEVLKHYDKKIDLSKLF